MAVIRASAFSAIALCAAHLVSAPIEVKVAGDRVNLRARPVFDAEVAGQVSSGVVLVAPDGIPDGAEWIKVRPPDSVDLWIFSALVHDGIVTADDTYVRCGPGQQYKPVGKVGKGFKIEPRGAASGDWLRIAPVPTAELYISSAYVLAVPSAAAAETANTSSPESPESLKSPESLEGLKGLKGQESPKPDPTGAATTQQPTEQPANEQTNQPTNEPTNNEPTNQRINEKTDKPSNRQTVKPSTEIAAVPAAIAGYALAVGPRQGEVVTLRGRLERLSIANAPSFSKYQLVDKAGYPRSTVICHIIGLPGQWYELAGSEIEIEGRLWTISDSFSASIPVIDASRVRRIASWDK
jgi:uncharacterized protein YgiM (DUF1202 family)